MTPPRKFSALPPQALYEASPKAISRRTSYLRVRLEFLPYPHLIPTLFNGCGSGPPLPLTAASSWTWIDHPVSGLQILTYRPIKTCSRSGSTPLVFNLASTRNSPDRSTKSTRSYLNVVPQLVNTGFQVLFHSPPGVLFTFPSQYYALSVTLQFRVRGFHPLWLAFPKPFCYRHQINCAVRTPGCTHPGLGSAGFARRYSRYRCFFLFLRLLRCFSSPGSPPYVMDWRMDTGGLLQWVSPFRYLRIYGYLLLPAAFRSLSRLSSALSAKASTLRSCSLNLAGAL